jgi:hypothetical protein
VPSKTYIAAAKDISRSKETDHGCDAKHGEDFERIAEEEGEPSITHTFAVKDIFGSKKTNYDCDELGREGFERIAEFA